MIKIIKIMKSVVKLIESIFILLIDIIKTGFKVIIPNRNKKFSTRISEVHIGAKKIN